MSTHIQTNIRSHTLFIFTHGRHVYRAVNTPANVAHTTSHPHAVGHISNLIKQAKPYGRLVSLSCNRNYPAT